LLEANDCFCIQQTQGGLLQEAQQRFLLLPLGLRRAAFEQRRTTGYSRLWGDIETFTRRYGVTRGGHLERFLRPNFKRLLPLRHAFEAEPGQVGAAYFIGGRLAGVELAPTAAYWQDLFPILTMYCYGPAALMAERKRWTTERQVVDRHVDVCREDRRREPDHAAGHQRQQECVAARRAVADQHEARQRSNWDPRAATQVLKRRQRVEARVLGHFASKLRVGVVGGPAGLIRLENDGLLHSRPSKLGVRAAVKAGG
jgi:hypothetical protein